MNIENLLKQETQQRTEAALQYEKVVASPKFIEPNNVHSTPIKPKSAEVIQTLLEQETRDREARERMIGVEPETSVETPASIYHEIHGETMLKSVMELSSDNALTEEINNYILSKMRIGKMQDTRDNFEKVLNRLLAKNSVSRIQQKPYLINKLHMYLNSQPDEEDDLILSIIKKGARRNGLRR